MKVLFFICLLSVCAFAQNRDLFFIDDFVTNTPPQIIQIPNNPSFPITKSVSTQSDTIFGGERDIFLQADSGNPQLLLTAGVSGGNYTAATPNGARGFSTLTYDGADNSNTLNPSGLGGANFRAEGGFAFRTTFRSDIATTVTFQVYSGSLNNVCSTTINVPANNVDQQYILRFDNDFSNGCDFSQVGALVVTFDQPDNVDIIMQLISVYAPIPQSASITPTQTRTPTPVPQSPSQTPPVTRTPTGTSTPTRIPQSQSNTPSVTSTRTPSQTPSPSSVCRCKCPVFTCELIKHNDEYKYFFNFVPFFDNVSFFVESAFNAFLYDN